MRSATNGRRDAGAGGIETYRSRAFRTGIRRLVNVRLFSETLTDNQRQALSGDLPDTIGSRSAVEQIKP